MNLQKENDFYTNNFHSWNCNIKRQIWGKNYVNTDALAKNHEIVIRKTLYYYNLLSFADANEQYLRRSLLKNGSLKICAHTGLRLSEVASADPQSFNDEERNFSTFLYVS